MEVGRRERDIQKAGKRTDKENEEGEDREREENREIFERKDHKMTKGQEKHKLEN